eukprot:scaffold3768_cov376-Prasinococcus_capsulatus_cf.AAC.25
MKPLPISDGGGATAVGCPQLRSSSRWRNMLSRTRWSTSTHDVIAPRSSCSTSTLSRKASPECNAVDQPRMAFSSLNSDRELGHVHPRGRRLRAYRAQCPTAPSDLRAAALLAAGAADRRPRTGGAAAAP